MIANCIFTRFRIINQIEFGTYYEMLYENILTNDGNENTIYLADNYKAVDIYI